MTTLADCLAAVHAAPEGPRVAAIFDYDGTVISGYSATAFYRHRLLRGQLGPRELIRTLSKAADGIDSEEDFGAVLELSLQAWRGKTDAELAELGEHLLREDIGGRLHSEIWQLVDAHRAKGHTIVLASSATKYQVEPIARELGADHVLHTQLETRNGVLTGRALGEPLWGAKKATAVRALARSERFFLKRSFAYANGGEDLPLLALVGNPVAVQPEAALADEARRRRWPMLQCVARGGTPGVRDVARTAAFYGGLAAGFGTGIGLALLNRSRRDILDVGAGVGCDVALSLAGVDVEVVSGAEHIWSSRPCVFIFNHQSNVDPVVVMKLLRDGFTGVAKAEARNIPGFGQFFQVAGVAFVERGNTGQARRALEPVVAKIRDEGLSVLIAPEGTRSITPRLGPFKKGAFHIAMQAGVPVVPIVIRNGREVQWRAARVLRPGTIQVAVLPPVPTTDWRVSELGERVAGVRDDMLRTLRAWPGDPDGVPGLAERAVAHAI
jgi:putative phosphoserine phosphatase/1-acylglycerol-3-phosphate O-acyltransferase